MSKGRLTFNLQDKEQMQQYRLLLGGQYVGRKSKRVEKDEEHSTSDGDMRTVSEGV